MTDEAKAAKKMYIISFSLILFQTVCLDTVPNSVSEIGE